MSSSLSRMCGFFALGAVVAAVFVLSNSLDNANVAATDAAVVGSAPAVPSRIRNSAASTTVTPTSTPVATLPPLSTTAAPSQAVPAYASPSPSPSTSRQKPIPVDQVSAITAWIRHLNSTEMYERILSALTVHRGWVVHIGADRYGGDAHFAADLGYDVAVVDPDASTLQGLRSAAEQFATNRKERGYRSGNERNNNYDLFRVNESVTLKFIEVAVSGPPHLPVRRSAAFDIAKRALQPQGTNHDHQNVRLASLVDVAAHLRSPSGNVSTTSANIADAAEIFFLSVDVEGHMAPIWRGALPLFVANKVGIARFSVSPAAGGDALQPSEAEAMTKALHESGYDVFYVSSSTPVARAGAPTPEPPTPAPAPRRREVWRNLRTPAPPVPLAPPGPTLPGQQPIPGSFPETFGGFEGRWGVAGDSTAYGARPVDKELAAALQVPVASNTGAQADYMFDDWLFMPTDASRFFALIKPDEATEVLAVCRRCLSSTLWEVPGAPTPKPVTPAERSRGLARLIPNAASRLSRK